ncbi:hypothetical protein SAMN04489712_1317 [Thermomonospora echinospora]|uniref:Uncharacterized protein n=1 Tax=Thermomonospora echinospora TaxID=1992 RepID=A0A1H6E2V4_9ACTN|nr:hypothetical protein [Thermomonospora echinospora]SEG91867.1 hypothetical protein SAMN04489712_1317 [Thermomonospora echinospora]
MTRDAPPVPTADKLRLPDARAAPGVDEEVVGHGLSGSLSRPDRQAHRQSPETVGTPERRAR